MATIGVVGLGAMGARVAVRLADAGNDLVVWNRDSAKAEPLVERGAVAAETPAEAARKTEAVITMVADPVALAAVTEGPDGVVAGASDGTTVSPDATERLASQLPGDAMLDSPVLGSFGEVEAGTLNVFVGGEDGPTQRWSP